MFSKKQIIKTLKENPSYILALFFLSLLVLASVFAPLTNLDPTTTNVSNMNHAPSLEYWFGTDELGRNYFARVIYGGRVSLLVGLLAMLTSTVIGTIIGLLSGYFGGFLDNFLMRLVDVLSSIPWLVLVIVLSSLLRPGLLTIILVIGGFSWMNIARLVRAETIAAKTSNYVDYASFLGVKHLLIIWRHIFPFVLPTLLVAATNSVSSSIMTESALSFLGMGIQAPMASWGNLLQGAQTALQRAPHMAILPGFFIALTIYSFNKLGDFIQTLLQKRG